MQIPIIIGIIIGILTCLLIKNPKTFVDPFIVFGFVYFFVVFIFLTIKIGHTKFIRKNPLKYFWEVLFIGLITYLYLLLVYYFRGVLIMKDHPYFILFSLLMIAVHTLVELSGLYDR
uniref:Uncharacterized protein n=1 Tax=viral metagenome TaxID=1070528 RepID=A0A6C0D3G8_9ZZZZ